MSALHVHGCKARMGNQNPTPTSKSTTLGWATRRREERTGVDARAHISCLI